MNLFEGKEFISHAGNLLSWKIEADVLTDKDLETLAKIVSDKIKFFLVYGVPTGGSRFAAALNIYATLNDKDPVLIVDDVLTTGQSIIDLMNKFADDTIGVVIFARGKCPNRVLPIFQLNDHFN